MVRQVAYRLSGHLIDNPSGQPRCLSFPCKDATARCPQAVTPWRRAAQGLYTMLRICVRNGLVVGWMTIAIGTLFRTLCSNTLVSMSAPMASSVTILIP